MLQFYKWYRTASLLRPARCYAPPPLFSGEITVKGYFTSITRPPAGRSSRFAVLQFCTCTRVASVEELYMCIKRVENSLRTGLGPFADFGRFPEAVILPSRPVGGVWLRDYLLCFATCTWPTTLPSFSTATAWSSRLLPHYRVCEFVEGGGLTARRKRKSSLLRPPPSFS